MIKFQKVLKALPSYINIVWILVLALVSCSSEQLEESLADSSSKQAQSLKVEETLEVEYLGQLMLMAVSPDGKRFLCLDWQRQEYVFIDRLSGDIISSFSKAGDRPDNPGYGLRAPSFYGNEAMLIGGTNGVFVYSMDGEVLQSYKYKNQPSPGILYTSAGSFIYPVNIQGTEKFIFPTTAARSAPKTERAFYENWRSISIYSPDDQSFTSIIPLPSNSRYYDGMVYEQSHLMSTYTIIEDVLWLSTGAEPRLRGYKISDDFALISDFSLQLFDYELPEGVEPVKADPNSVVFEGDLAGIKNIFPFQDQLAVVYFPGFSKSQKEAMANAWEVDGVEGYQELYDKFKLATPFRLMILSKDGESVADLPIATNFEGGDLIISGDEIWVQKMENDESEEDFVSFIRLSIQSGE